MKQKLSWKAARRGGIYCAPACGCDCTWSAYQDALQKSKDLAAQMGDGWQGEVWENCGWHYKAVGYGGRANIHVNEGSFERTSYTAFLSPEANSGGRWAETARTPKAALSKVVKQARCEFDKLAELFLFVAAERTPKLTGRRQLANRRRVLALTK